MINLHKIGLGLYNILDRYSIFSESVIGRFDRMDSQWIAKKLHMYFESAIATTKGLVQA